MPEPTTTTTVGAIITGAKTAIPVITEVHKLLKERGILEAIVDGIRRRPTKHVLVVGTSGAGKTSLLRYLRGLNPRVERAARTTGDEDPIKGKIQQNVFRFIDTPGHADHRAKLTKAIMDAAREKQLGIINVVSYGYHEATALPLQTAVENSKISQAFLQKNRDAEIAQLSYWVGLLAGRGGAAKWVITVVTKADLWWTPEMKDIVLDYYRSGSYHERRFSRTETTSQWRT
jgi:ethanolamine utilization protein EutP (predicted NTPase)